MTDQLKKSHFASGYDAGRAKLEAQIAELKAENAQLKAENANAPAWQILIHSPHLTLDATVNTPETYRGHSFITETTPPKQDVVIQLRDVKITQLGTLRFDGNVRFEVAIRNIPDA